MRAENPQLIPHSKIPAMVNPDGLTGHIVLIGGVVWNQMAGRLPKMANLPIRQVEHPLRDLGEIFLAGTDDRKKEFWPQWTDGGPKLLEADVGPLAREPNRSIQAAA
jgi:hypothetical protein